MILTVKEIISTGSSTTFHSLSSGLSIASQHEQIFVKRYKSTNKNLKYMSYVGLHMEVSLFRSLYRVFVYWSYFYEGGVKEG